MDSETVIQADFDTNTQSDSPNESDGQGADLSANTPELPSIDASRIHPNLLTQANLHQPLFNISQLGIDRRLLVNRKRQLKMYRVWMQGKFVKI
jgi:tRNAThr (cytosine32-N3)-methyltransferase